LLSAQIQHLLTLDPDLVREVLVVSDGSTDASAAILRQLANPRLRVHLLEQQAGKAAALNHLLEHATGEILLFVDIRPRIEPGAVAALLSNFADPRVGCVAGELRLASDGLDATTSAVSGLYWRYEQWIRTCEAAFDSPVGVYGGFYAVRRALVTSAPTGLILDDMFQPLAIIRQGFRSVIDRSAQVSDRWPAETRNEFQRKVRTLAGNFQLLAVAPWVLLPRNRVLFQLVSHKLMRLFVPWLLMALLLSALVLARHSFTFAIAAALQILFWLMAATALKRPIPLVQQIARPASALLILNAAAVAGLFRFLFSRRPLWQTWIPTAVPSRTLDPTPTPPTSR
jgi:cellulose synthase/poly-beta-1,6-N-acetylglucosamine synthase-like glycosyltransferase